MKRTLLLMLLSLVLLCPAGFAQQFHPCFDLNSDSASNVIDLVRLSDYFVGGPAIPSGHGDIDGRAGLNLGDSRFFSKWLFYGEPTGSCPPHPPYTLQVGTDTLFVGSDDLPAGSGTIQLPIILKAQNPVTDLMIPFQVVTTSGTVTIASIDEYPPSYFDLFNKGWNGDTGIIHCASIINNAPGAGLHILALVTLDYANSTGGFVTLEATSPAAYQFPHYVFGDNDQPYSTMTIASLPVVTGPLAPAPLMSVDPDSLYFETLIAYPNPDPQSFTVNSDGALFAWTLTHQNYLQVSPTSGVSGQTVEVIPDITGLGVGTHHATIIVESTEALGSPRIVDVYIKLKPQYPSFDANCDGNFSIGDIVLQINYIFGGATFPCDPCTGQPTE